MTITVDDKRTDHVKPLPSCLNIEKEDFSRLLQITFFPEYFYSETCFTVLRPVVNDIVVDGSTGLSTEKKISSLSVQKNFEKWNENEKTNKTKRNIWVHLRLIQKTSEHLIVKINSIDYEITVAYYAITAGVIPSPTFSSHQEKRWSISYLSTYKSTLTLRISMIQLSDLW